MTGEVEIVNPESVSIDERTIRAFEKIAEKTMLDIVKRDYRATVVHREESGQLPDAVNTFMEIDESKTDDLGNPVELDVKGTITPFEAYRFKEVNYATALVNLKDWKYFEVPIKGKDGTIQVEKVPVLLAQIDMLSKKRLNLSVNGSQSRKHIEALRANANLPPDGDYFGQIMNWAGIKTTKKTKSELDQNYNVNVERR